VTEISNAEFEVLEALWQHYPASTTEVIERLNQASNQEKLGMTIR